MIRQAILVVVFLLITGALFFLFDEKNKNPKEQTAQPQLQMQTNNSQGNSSANDTNNQLNSNQGNGPLNDTQMKKEILKEGAGESAKIGDKITVNYTGWLEDGTKFDSSVGKAPFSFNIGSGVIEGWSQGLLGAKAGEKLKLTIPPELGYGSQGAGEIIPPNATLIFEIEVLKIGQ